MKTVADFAKEIDVTPKTVYKWLRRVRPIYSEVLTEKKGSVTYITEKGIVVLTETITKVKPKEVKDCDQVKPEEPEEVLYLREQNKVLLDELNREREHSRTMSEQLAELARNSQVLLGAEQSRTNPVLLTGEDKPKKSFWDKFRNRPS